MRSTLRKGRPSSIFLKEIQRFCHKMSNIRKIYKSQQITAITANTHTHEHTFDIFSAQYHKHSLITWVPGCRGFPILCTVTCFMRRPAFKGKRQEMGICSTKAQWQIIVASLQTLAHAFSAENKFVNERRTPSGGWQRNGQIR